MCINIARPLVFLCSEVCVVRDVYYNSQTTFIPREPQCLPPRPNCELGVWDPPPSPASGVSLPAEGGTKGRTHSSAGEGIGGSQFGRLGKKLRTLSTLCCKSWIGIT